MCNSYTNRIKNKKDKLTDNSKINNFHSNLYEFKTII